MSHGSSIALLSLAILLAGTPLGSSAAAAQDQRAHSERPQGRPGGGERSEARPGGGVRQGGEGRPAFDGRGQILDQRYNHGRYYPPLGTVRPTLPGSIDLIIAGAIAITSMAASGTRRAGRDSWS